MDTIVHEGAGHGYQDYVLENKDAVLKHKPALKDQIDMFDLSYKKGSAPRDGISYEATLNRFLYRYSDPAERDAWALADRVSGGLTKVQKP